MKITIEIPQSQFTEEDRKRIAAIIENLSALVGGIVTSEAWGSGPLPPCEECGHLDPWHPITCSKVGRS